MKAKRTIKTYELVHQLMRQFDIIVTREQHGFTAFDQDIVSPHLVLSYCHQGTARVMYDMREFTFKKGILGIASPEHVLNQLDCSDDFVFTRIVISKRLFDELHTHVFSHDNSNFQFRPTLLLTDEQAGRLLAIADILDAIAKHDAKDGILRRQVMLAQLTVGYEIIHYYRRMQDLQTEANSHAGLFVSFCELVVEHFRESREVKYYANQLQFTPKHFTKIIRQETGDLSPAEWIEQYIITQAKQLIVTRPQSTLCEISFLLGFSEPTSFYRYFKRVTGITAKAFRDSAPK